MTTVATDKPTDSRDFKVGHLDDLLLEKLETAFHKHTRETVSTEVSKIAIEHDPIDLAIAMIRLPLEARLSVYQNLPNENAQSVFLVHTGATTRSFIFRNTPDSDIAVVLDQTPPDDIVELLDDVTNKKAVRLLSLLDPEKAQRISKLRQHKEHSAGRLMTNEFFAFHINTTIGSVIDHIRDNPGIELTRSIFVLNDKNELTGFVPSRNIIINAHDLTLKQIMRPVLHYINPSASREEIVDLVGRYDISVLPIVDDNQFLIGVITYEDVVEMMEDLEDKTIATIAGTGEAVGEEVSTLKRIFWRAPWLLVTLAAGMCTATGMSHFFNSVWFAVVPFFVSLIAGMSGNVGIQCSTILVRGLATGEISPGARSSVMRRELLIGVSIGIMFGLICGSVGYLFSQLGILKIDAPSIAVAATVCGGVFAACCVATTLGVLSPFFFASLGIDPAVAAGPIVTALNDLMSTFTYFFVAYVVFHSLT